MICIVSGPSSVGKTTFIRSGAALCPGITDRNTIRFANEGRLPDGDDTSLFHYNTLRPVHFCQGKDRFLPYRLAKHERQLLRSLPLGGLYWWRLKSCWNYEKDADWLKIRNSHSEKKAIVLLASLSTLKQRVRERTVVEDNTIGSVYDSEFWFDVYEKISLSAMYELWIKELRNSNIEYSLIDGNDSEYRALSKSIDITRFVSGLGNYIDE